MESVRPNASLPVPYMRRLNPIPERTFYLARPGVRAIPSGVATTAVFVSFQGFTLIMLLWAIWWPAPISTGDYAFAISCTAVLASLVIGVFLLLLRKYPGFLIAVLRSPFISLHVTDRRIMWTLPWMKAPLMEIGRERVLGGIVGMLDARGNGPAAVILVPGDPSADIDGNIHFDRLPDAAAFVAALQGQ
ncbi:hypothetical protein [Sphingomonas crusticola]|uniref:hypothetical protein n=1 Tax=Sphingomonas crusticola TaxID=1697973 RepID=UPI000E27D58C|nr:hypothetical protein [Sphingomonas crusticola]